MTNLQKETVLFICTHNSVRSQMAEAILRKKYGDHFIAWSAGTNPTSINPYAKRVLAELDIDISTQESKHIGNFFNNKIDLVVTVCDSAKEECPFFPGANQYEHISFKDPSEHTGTEEETLTEFRRIRDEISNWIEKKFGQRMPKKRKS
ncbi:MAG: arsenate reductase ArsC [Candidatus Hodarchaeota archaeon]